MVPDPYSTLGVSKDTPQEEIKEAYRKLAKQYHPDLNPGNAEAERKFKEISAAYDLLGSPEKRKKFDLGEVEFPSGSAQREQRGPFYYETQQGGGRYTQSFEGLDEDFLESLFKGFKGSKKEAYQFRGEDQYYLMEVEFHDAILGAEKEITLPTQKVLRVKIPAGIESGKKLRFARQGSPGAGTGPPGDVFVEIKVKPSPVFKRMGQDLEMELAISLNEAILGADVEVPTLEKPIKLKIPAGASTGQRLRLKEKGVLDQSTKKRGNLLVILKVVMPSHIDDELKTMIEKWSQSHSYNPRK
ncbi:MAG: J domain-containing protein [SAR324 cluster bacterium]|nr:J domain-containing protein [SAR324 cluster bacterium]